MTKYLLDSDILIDFFKKKQYMVTLVKRLYSQATFGISILSVAELRAGWTEKEAAFFIPRLYAFATTEGITGVIAELSGKWRHQYKTTGLTLPTIDTLIAATACTEGYILITRNTRAYPMPEVKLYDFEETR